MVPNAFDRRSAVSAVIPVSSFAIRYIRVRGTPQILASFPADSANGTKNSSRRTSPGCMGGRFLTIRGFSGCGRSVVIDKLYVGRTSAGPDKANPELVVDPDRVLSRAIAPRVPNSGQSF